MKPTCKLAPFTPMKRRNFLQNSLAACLAAGALAERTAAAETSSKKRDLYELRVYTLKSAKKPLLDSYLSKAFIPALKRLKSGPVGVFSESLGEDRLAVYVLSIFSSAEVAATLPDRLAADHEYLQSGAEYLAAPASDPVYDRIDVSLHRAVEGLPTFARTDPSQPRIFNLRIYESHNERAAQKKIEMFNTRELTIFLRVGLMPVFLSETVIGTRMPNLTYMLVFPDDAARLAAWKRFGADEDWKKLKAVPEYADKEIVSKITNKILTPETYSEI